MSYNSEESIFYDNGGIMRTDPFVYACWGAIFVVAVIVLLVVALV